MSKRWPLHPPPFPNESLLSWIMRIASLYDMEPKNLLMYEFGINLEVHNLYSIDLNPPINLLNGLSERTGIELNTIKALTTEGYIPLLIDTLESSETTVFNDYTNQFYIFPGKRKYITDLNNSWIPWFSTNRFATAQGCEACLSENHEQYLRLHWRFPWMMSCPIHKLLLEEVILCGVVQQKVFFSSNRSNEYGRSAGLDDLYAMDNITLQAVTQGIVELPSGRRLHGGVWLRILRTLIEELNTIGKIIGSRNRALITPFWKELNLFVREGFSRYVVFEQLSYKKQLTLMRVASLVFKAIFSEKVKFTSSVVSMLSPIPSYENDLSSVYIEPDVERPLSYIYEGRVSGFSEFNKFNEYTDRLISIMRFDPDAVKWLRNFIRTYDNNGTKLLDVDRCLEELGININTSK